MKNTKCSLVIIGLLMLSSNSFAAITEKEFNQSIQKVLSAYKPVVKSFNANLVINGEWSNNEVEGLATRKKDEWNVRITGGLARQKRLNQDAFTLIICHEVGHHLGGYPKVTNPESMAWASNEGQADYFSTLKCARKVFEGDDNVSIVKKLNASNSIVKLCEKAHGNVSDSAICIRSSMASKLVAETDEELNASGEGRPFRGPRFESQAFPTFPKKIINYHPNPQCRLDTLLQGSLCDKGLESPLSDTENSSGVCAKELGDVMGLRPDCWYNIDSEDTLE